MWSVVRVHCLPPNIMLINNSMKIRNIINESVTFWVPDAPRKMRDEECWFCKGTGVEGYYTQKGKWRGTRTYSDTDDIEQLKAKDAKFDKYLDKLKLRLEFAQDFYDANKENPAAQQMLDNLKDIENKVKHRKARIEQRIKALGELKPITCDRCDGKGTTKEEISDAPELNVSNSNASVILKMLGIEIDYAGSISPNQIPDIKRRLMTLRSTDGLGQFTRDDEVSQSSRREVDTDPETGLDRISTKKGAKMYSIGLEPEQIEAYIERMAPILDYAQRNNLEIVWG